MLDHSWIIRRAVVAVIAFALVTALVTLLVLRGCARSATPRRTPTDCNALARVTEAEPKEGVDEDAGAKNS